MGNCSACSISSKEAEGNEVRISEDVLTATSRIKGLSAGANSEEKTMFESIITGFN